MSKSRNSGRTWVTSQKPAWSRKKMEKLAKDLSGSAKVYMINHDKDEEDGKKVETHTHFVIDYQTPRKISTVANLLGTEPNFIQPCISKKASLRYLLHLDDSDKAQYKPEEVIHNDQVIFEDVIKGQSMSDSEIAEYLYRGEDLKLLGIVPYNKLATIQRVVANATNKKVHRELYNARLDIMKLKDGIDYQNKEMKKLNNKINKLADSVVQILDITKDFQKGAVTIGKAINDKMRPFFEEHLIGAFKNIEVIAKKALEDKTA